MKNHLTHLMAAALALAPLLVSCGDDGGQVVHVTGVTLRTTTLSMAVGESRLIEATVEPSNATNKKLSWVSSNPLVAGVANGTVTGLRSGRANIIVSSEDGGKSAMCSLAVGPNVAAVYVDPVALSLTLSGTGTLVARIEPADARNQAVTWMSDRPSVATADPSPEDDLVCLVRAQGVGSATITVITNDGARTAKCNVTVETGEIIDVTGVTLNKDATTIGMGSRETLVATVWPEDATFRALRWSSSDAGVAAVSGNGVVSAVGPGGAVITARTVDGNFEASCDVTIASVYAAGYEFSPGMYVSRVWKDDEPRDLSSGATTARANSVYVSGSAVYAAGFENNSEQKKVARLWIGGTPMSLSNGMNPTEAKSVFVSDNNVYVAGVEDDGTVSTARLWINGTPLNLSSGAASAEARSVFVSDDPYYYVAGHEMGPEGKTVARLWTNDPAQQQTLSNGSRDEQATCVHVSGGNVYVAGFEKNETGRTVAKLWINGAPTSLTDGRHNAKAWGVFVTEDNTYYAVGFEYNANGLSVARLWTSDAAQAPNLNLSDGTANAEALSVSVLGGSVYAVGTEENAAYGRPTGRLWLNGAPRPLGNGTDNSAALAVFLK